MGATTTVITALEADWSQRRDIHRTPHSWAGHPDLADHTPNELVTSARHANCWADTDRQLKALAALAANADELAALTAIQILLPRVKNLTSSGITTGTLEERAIAVIDALFERLATYKPRPGLAANSLIADTVKTLSRARDRGQRFAQDPVGAGADLEEYSLPAPGNAAHPAEELIGLLRRAATEKWITPARAARLLDRDTTTIYRWISQGRLVARTNRHGAHQIAISSLAVRGISHSEVITPLSALEARIVGQWRLGDTSTSDLADQHGVHPKTIARLRRGAEARLAALSLEAAA